MSRLLVCCRQDIPSMNMKRQLLEKERWEDIGSDGVNSYFQNGNIVMIVIDNMHIYAENIDKTAENFGIRVDDIVVLSKHSSASKKPTLTVHPIGNYKENHMGGRAKTLVKSSPHLMSGTLRKIFELNDNPTYSVSFEVTHHGPYVDTPTMYIEVGSEESCWNDEHAAKILMDSLMSAEEKDNPVVVGVGGGHYAPKFSKLVLTKNVDVGHMVPNYQIVNSSDEEVSRMIFDAAKASDSDMVYVHKGSMKSSEEKRIDMIIDSLGLQRIFSQNM